MRTNHSHIGIGRRLRLSTWITSCLAAVLVAGPSAGAAGALQQAETITVVITLEDQLLDQSEVGRDEPAGPEAVIDLQEHAEREQAPVKAALDQLENQGDVESYDPLWIFNGIIVEVDPTSIGELQAIPGVASVSLDRPLVLAQGDAFALPEPGVATIGAPTLWDAGFAGEGVVVAVLDTGVDITHPDITASWRGGSNSWFDPYGENPAPVDTDVNGHGTAAASIIVGDDAGGTQIGVAPSAQLIAAKIFNNGGGSSLARVHQALQWVLDPDGNPFTDDGADIVNNSWTFNASGCDLEFELDLLALRAAGVLPVFAAGNGGPSLATSRSPGNNPSALSVGSVDGGDLIAPGSSRGPNACTPSEAFPDLTAPGVGIRSAGLNGGYVAPTGTSFAAPHVAGAAALLLSQNPDLGVYDLESALLSGAVDLGVPGIDNVYGAGRLDVSDAVANPPNGSALDRLVTFTGNLNVPGIGLTADEDIVSYDADRNRFSMVFDGSDVGAKSDVDGFALVDPNTLLLSFDGNITLPDIGRVDDSDIVQFDGTLGPNTSGTFSVFFDGSLSGLTTAAEDVDAVEILADGTLLVSTLGNPVVPGLAGLADEDVLAFSPEVPGNYSSGTWSLYLDGSTVGLAAGSEDVAGVFASGDGIAVTTVGNFSVPGLTGTDEDILRCDGRTPSSCTGFTSLFDGSAIGLPGAADINGADLAGDPGPPPPGPGARRLMSFLSNTAVPGLGLVADEDIVAADSGTGAFSMIFDGSEFGLVGSVDIDGFALPDVDRILMSFAAPATIPGIGRVDDSDVVGFDRVTEVFSLVLDGSAVGLTTSAEDVDAIEVLADGTLLVSTLGNPSVAGVSGAADEDLLAFTPAIAGDYSSGTWSLYFDGSAVGLLAGSEDVSGAYLEDGELRLTTVGNFSVSALSGADEDIFGCTAFVPITTCDSFSQVFDGSGSGLPAGADLDGISREP